MSIYNKIFLVQFYKNICQEYITPDNEVIVICKYLCGSGLDFAMDYFYNSSIKMTYFLLAMCCCNKIDLFYGHFDGSTIDEDTNKNSGWFTIKDKCSSKYLLGVEIVKIFFNSTIKKYEKYGYGIEVCHHVDKDITFHNYLVIGHQC